MDKWNNPIVIDYINYMGLNPSVAFEKEVEYLLLKTNQLFSNIFSNGVDIDKIAIFLNLKDKKYIYKDNLTSPAHIIQHSTDSTEIELKRDKSNFIYYKHRFIIAHEIGHWIIRTKLNKIYSVVENSLIEKHKNEEELLCHLFASELLMPTKIFLKETENQKLNNNLINRLYRLFKVPDYQIINKFLLVNDEYIGIYWKKKTSPYSKKEALRVLNFFPDNKFRKLPYIPIHATAKSDRFNPNIILDSFKKNESLTGEIVIKNFGDISGNYEVFVYNPIRNNTIFEDYNFQRKFDLITIFKKTNSSQQGV